MIAYVKAWQNVLNEVAAQRGISAFHFNTYIISVLVIFFLQIEQKCPKVKDVSSSQTKCINSIPSINKGKLKRAVVLFFDLYGINYSIKGHLISINIGRWQEPEYKKQQKSFSSEQKRFAKLKIL